MDLKNIDTILDAHFGPEMERLPKLEITESQREFVELMAKGKDFDAEKFWDFLGRPQHREGASELEKCADYLDVLNRLRDPP